MKILCKVSDHAKLVELDSELEQQGKKYKERLMFLKKQAEDMSDKSDKEKNETWDKITNYLVGMELLGKEAAEKVRDEKLNLGFEDGHIVSRELRQGGGIEDLLDRLTRR